MKTKTKKFKLFKPIVASSLALILGSSLYGQNITNTSCEQNTNCTNITDNITFKFGNTPMGQSIDFTGNTVTFGKDISTVTLKDSGFQSQKFDFPNKTMTVTLSAGKTFNLTAEKDVFKGNLTINDLGDGGKDQIGAKFTGAFSKGMEGNIFVSRTEKEAGRTTLTFSGGDLGKSGAKNTITLQRTSTIGNNGGDNGALVLDFSNNKDGNLYADIQSVSGGGGKVIIKGYTQTTQATQTSATNDNHTTTLHGNIGNKVLGGPDTKDLIVTFEGAKMVGNIQTGIGWGNESGNDYQKKVITFKKASSSATATLTTNTENTDNFVLEGDIISFGTGRQGHLDKTKGNHVTFENGSMKGNIKAERTWHDQRFGYNNVTFKEDGAKLKGNIQALGGFNETHHVTNDVKFEGKNSSIVGDITADRGGRSGFGHNNIIFKNNGNITGNIKSGGNKAQNIISLNNMSSTPVLKTNEKTNVLKITNITSTNSVGGGNFIGKNILSNGNGTNFTDNTSKIFDTSHQADGSLETQTIDNTNGNNKINIETLTLTNSGKIDANGKAYNQINTKTLSTQSGANSTIIARWGGTNKIAASDSINLTLSALNAGDNSASDKDNRNTNIISLGSSMSAEKKVLENGTSSNLTITSITSTGGKNYIGKNILKASNADLDDNTSSMKFTDDSNAFEGNLQVGSTSSTNNGWNNISFKASETILPTMSEETKKEKESKSDKNNTKPQNAIIGSLTLESMTKDEKQKDIKATPNNLLKTAISGSNNLYLDLSKNKDFANVSNLIVNKPESSQTLEQKDLLSKVQAVILGNIDNQVNGTNNIKIVGGSEATSSTSGSSSTSGTTSMMATQAAGMTDNTHIKIGLVGNIITNGGSNNIIFENSIWLPSYLSSTEKEKTGKVLTTLPQNLSGTLTNSNNGTTNIVLRTSSATLNNLGTSMFNVDNQSGNVNIVVQGEVNIGANISYAGITNGNTTFIFANSNDMKTSSGAEKANNNGVDSFANNNSTDTSNQNSKVLGVTYKDGVKLTLKDKSIGGNGSFLNTYASYFDNVADKGLLTLKTNRNLSGSTQTDTITIKGLALGSITELSPSTQKEIKDNGNTTTYNYNVTLDKNSAFVGNISLQKNSNVTLTMNEGSKLLTDSKHLKIDTLTISTTGVKTDEILLNTFAQNNTIIDIATINSDGSLATSNNGSLNPSTRTDFRLLEIGKDSMQKEAGKNGNGLQGNGAIFRVYMNDGADQKSATLGGIKAQDMQQAAALQTQSSDNNDMKGQYGHVYSDRILILSGNVNAKANSNNDATKVNYIQALADTSTKLESIKYHEGGTEIAGNIAVATVKTSSGIKFQGATQIQGFDVVGTTLKAVTTDQYGKVNSKNGKNGENGTNDYTTYFIDSMTSQGASESIQSASSVALGSNYSLYMANINSLNKRMGELRYNANSQGVWARVFNGMLSSDLNLAHTKSLYTTLQAGYDYAFGMEGANNYLGFALSYINAINDSQAKLDIDGLNKGVKDSLSNGVEVAIYNAYVQDGASKASGWKNGLYTDTILKFSFMNNKLHMFGQTDDYSINNFALTFSQEAGYRFLLGNHNEWFIDPQAELTIGFFDQSEFVQKLGNNYLVGTQNAILNIRGRVGSNFGYKFDHLTENKGFTSQLYLGMYYLGNYTSGGDGALVSNLGSKTTLNALTSHSSFLINVGTNFTIKDKHRIYFDFERSFFGPIITNYQVNLGYRFSFGESKYTSLATNLANEIKKAKEVKIKAEEKKD